jgi:hypothetical protein
LPANICGVPSEIAQALLRPCNDARGSVCILREYSNTHCSFA